MHKPIILLLLIFAATTVFAQGPASTQLKKMNWLLGSWERTNAKPGRSAHERWEKKSDTEWVGYGVNYKGTDTTFVEKLKIAIKEGKLYYIADVPENKSEVYFEMTTVTDKDVVCENPKHDFPKKIEYHLQADGKLLATISAGDKKVDYWFERRK